MACNRTTLVYPGKPKNGLWTSFLVRRRQRSTASRKSIEIPRGWIIAILIFCMRLGTRRVTNRHFPNTCSLCCVSSTFWIVKLVENELMQNSKRKQVKGNKTCGFRLAVSQFNFPDQPLTLWRIAYANPSNLSYQLKRVSCENSLSCKFQTYNMSPG